MSESGDNKTNEETHKLKTSKNVNVAFKLNGKNYPLWSRLMRIAIGSRGAVSHIRDESLSEGDKGYQEWEETDLVVFSWIVDNIENDIIADFAHHQSAKAIWDNLAITYESKADPYLIYDLEEKANTIKQGEMDLETYYRKIHGLWINVDRCQKQPISCCDKGVKQFRQHTNEKRLFKFLAGLDPKYEGIRRDILKDDPLPSVETAYGVVKREAARRQIMPPSQTQIESAAGSPDTSSGEIGFGYGAQRNRGGHNAAPSRSPPTKPATTNDSAINGSKSMDKSKLWCTHCGKQKHTRETCFLRVGFPEWWEQKPKRASANFASGTRNEGRENMTTGGGGDCSGSGGNGGGGGAINFFGRLSENVAEERDGKGGNERVRAFNPNPKLLTGNYNEPFYEVSAVFHCQNDANLHKRGWIFDCGATDTMTPDIKDFSNYSKATKTFIKTANGELITVAGAGTIEISPNLCLSNCLFVPSLSQRLMSVSHVTRELNCTLLMFPNFCVLQDIRTKRIIGRGTEE